MQQTLLPNGSFVGCMHVIKELEGGRLVASCRMTGFEPRTLCLGQGSGIYGSRAILGTFRDNKQLTIRLKVYGITKMKCNFTKNNVYMSSITKLHFHWSK